MQTNVVVWVFESVKNNFRNVMPPDTLIVPYKKDRFNPWYEPPGVDPQDWEQNACENTATTFGLQGASKHAGLASLSELSEKYGTYKGSKIRFTMPVLYRHMLAKRKKASKASRVDLDYIDRWLNKLEPFNSRLFEVFNVNKGFPLEDWVNKNVIWELTGLTSELQAWFVNMKLAWKLAYRMANPHLTLKPCINVLDEASRLLLEGAPGYEEKFVFQLVRRGREFGEGVMICDQTASLLGHPVVANIFDMVGMCQSSGREIKFIKEEMYLNEDQASMLNKLEVGQAVVKMAGRCPDPFLVEIPKVSYDRVSDQEVEERMKPILESIPVEPGVDLPASKNSSEPGCDQSNLWKQMLKDIVDHLFDGVGKRYRRLKISPWVGDKIAGELVTMGLATSHSIGFGGRGDTSRFLWPTTSGFKYLGIDEITLAGKGGFEHILIQNRIAEGLKEHGYSPKIECHINGKSADLCFIKGAKEIAIEIELSPNDHTTENILKDLRAGFSEVWVLLKTKDQIKRAKEKAQKALVPNTKDGDDDVLNGRIHFRLIKEFL
jgi:hypothetical protein